MHLMSAKNKLCLELIPEPPWGNNLRSNMVGLGPGRWLKLSRATRTASGKCGICGSKDSPHDHVSM